MRIVRPDDRLASRAVMAQQVLQGLEHVAVAQIPGGARAVVHDAIVAFGVRDQSRVLHGVHESLAVVLRVGPALSQKIGQHRGDLLLARLVLAGEGRMAVHGGIRLPRSEAAIALTRHLGGLGVDALEIVQDHLNRVVQAVEIEPVERPPGRQVLACALCSRSQSTNSRTSRFRHIHIGNRANAVHSVRGTLLVPDIVVDARGVRPIALDGDEGEALLLDQRASDPCAHAIELRGAVGRLAEENHPRIADPLEHAARDAPIQSRRISRSIWRSLPPTRRPSAWRRAAPARPNLPRPPAERSVRPRAPPSCIHARSPG